MILGAGLLALTVIAFLCIPRHLPTTSSAALHPTFSASIENGRLKLSGAIGSEATKQAALARAQEVAKGARLRVSDDIEVMSDVAATGWEASLPALLTHLSILQPQQASLSITEQAATVTGTVQTGEAKTKLLHEVASILGPSIHLKDHVTVTSALSVSLVPNQASHAPSISRAQIQTGLDEALRGEHIAFESNSAVLTTKGRAVIDKVLPVLKRAPEASIEIGGHTDSYGDPDYNLQLSQKRADSVRQYLIDHAVTNRLTAVGYGSTHPLSHERTRAASKKNRRIELRVKEER
jgi:OOP family OmpA-OmpF porin